MDSYSLSSISNSNSISISSSKNEVRNKITDIQWLETFQSSMIRSLLYSDDDSYLTIHCKKLNPLSFTEYSIKFLQIFKQLFYKGPDLGCESIVQSPCIVNNFMVDALFKLIEITGNDIYKMAIDILLDLKNESQVDKNENSNDNSNESDILYLISKIQFLKNDEFLGINIIYKTLKLNPRNYHSLILESEFCLKKGKNDYALMLGIKAIESQPSEFKSWSNLVEIYIQLEKFEEALTTLNSCPMIPNREKFIPKSLSLLSSSPPHLPIPKTGILYDILNSNGSNYNDNDNDFKNKNKKKKIDSNLLNLPANNLKSTYLKAYNLLTKICLKIGWDKLLKFRANVFVMQEEYKKEKSLSLLTINNKSNTLSHHIKKNTNITHSNLNILEKEQNNDFKKKRLCERWLDNLFMILYEDLRIFTFWQSEYVHYKSKQLPYNKSSIEWEILGIISLRLQYKKESKDAFFKSLKNGVFSPRSTLKLILILNDEKNEIKLKQLTQNNLNDITTINNRLNQINYQLLDQIVKLSSWNHRWYSQFSPIILNTLKSLIKEEGLTKIKTTISANYSFSIPELTNNNGTENNGNNLHKHKHSRSKSHHYGNSTSSTNLDSQFEQNEGIVELMDSNLDFLNLYYDFESE